MPDLASPVRQLLTHPNLFAYISRSTVGRIRPFEEDHPRLARWGGTVGVSCPMRLEQGADLFYLHCSD